MLKAEFNKTLRTACTKGVLAPLKAAALPTETREAMMKFIVRNRGPVATCLLPDNVVDHDAWLNACGYMYLSISPKTGLMFRHTSEHQIH